MLPITKDFININPFSRTGKKLKAKRAIIMHYTASPGAPAMNISHYFDSLKRQRRDDNDPDTYAGAHYSVDRFKIIQSIPTNEEGYHVGSKTYTAAALSKLSSYPNNCTVGIEMCIEKDGSIHEDTFQNAADLAAWLIKNDGWPESIWTHKAVVGWKDCPLPWVKKPSEFERFKKAVADRLRPPKPVEKLDPPLAAPKEEDEENVAMKLADWAWKSIADFLDSKVKDGTLHDAAWVKKAQDKTLTASELAFLNTVILDRRLKEEVK